MNLIRKVVRKLQAYLRTIFSIPKEKKHNIISVKPHYKIVDRLDEHSIVVDLGTGEDADFSQDLTRRFGLKAYGFDPTKKHHPNLDSIVEKRKVASNIISTQFQTRMEPDPSLKALET